MASRYRLWSIPKRARRVGILIHVWLQTWPKTEVFDEFKGPERLRPASIMQSHGVKILLEHPWSFWDSHGSDIVVVVIFVVARERLGITPAPDSVTGFQNVDVGSS